MKMKNIVKIILTVMVSLSLSQAMMGFPEHIMAYKQMKVATKQPLTKKDIELYMKIPYEYGMTRLFSQKESKKIYRVGFKKAYEKVSKTDSLEHYVGLAVTASGVKPSLDKQAKKRGFKDAQTYLVTVRRIESALEALSDKNAKSSKKQDIDFVRLYREQIYAARELQKMIR